MITRTKRNLITNKNIALSRNNNYSKFKQFPSNFTPRKSYAISFQGIKVMGIFNSAKATIGKAAEDVASLIRKNGPGVYEEIDGSLSRLSKEEIANLKKIDDSLWPFGVKRRKQKVMSAAQLEKNAHLRQKAKEVEESRNRAVTADKIAQGLTQSLEAASKAGEIQRQREAAPVQAIISALRGKKGFDAIAGYEHEKKVFHHFFVGAIEEERRGRTVKIPGSVLLFGPTGNGKTSLTKAFSQQTGCAIVPIRILVSPTKSIEEIEEKFWDKLTTVASSSKDLFERERKRTIIFVDEADKVINNASSVKQRFEDFITSCSENHHCSVFAATNHPFNLGLDASNTSIFPVRIAVDPPGRTNTISVLQHYLRQRSSGEFDSEVILEAFAVSEGKGAYSNSQIERMCNEIAIATKNDITQRDLIEKIKETEPAIDEAALEKFKKESKHFLGIKI